MCGINGCPQHNAGTCASNGQRCSVKEYIRAQTEHVAPLNMCKQASMPELCHDLKLPPAYDVGKLPPGQSNSLELRHMGAIRGHAKGSLLPVCCHRPSRSEGCLKWGVPTSCYYMLFIFGCGNSSGVWASPLRQHCISLTSMSDTTDVESGPLMESSYSKCLLLQRGYCLQSALCVPTSYKAPVRQGSPRSYNGRTIVQLEAYAHTSAGTHAPSTTMVAAGYNYKSIGNATAC